MGLWEIKPKSIPARVNFSVLYRTRERWFQFGVRGPDTGLYTMKTVDTADTVCNDCLRVKARRTKMQRDDYPYLIGNLNNEQKQQTDKNE
jgi:hypothetical protein